MTVPEAWTRARTCFDEAGLRALYERLNQHPFELETSGEEAMKGTIDAGEGGTLFLTIPYDEGWTVTVDGKEAITRPGMEGIYRRGTDGGNPYGGTQILSAGTA